jgi:hypothetical protein
VVVEGGDRPCCSGLSALLDEPGLMISRQNVAFLILSRRSLLPVITDAFASS